MKKNFDLYETIKDAVKEAMLEVLAQMYGMSTLEAGSESGDDNNSEGEDDNDSNNNDGTEDKDKKKPIRPKPIFGAGGFSLR